MKNKILFIITTFVLVITYANNNAQTKGIPLSTNPNAVVWYDSLYSGNKSATINFEMKYGFLGFVLQNKSATIADSIRIFSVTRGYQSTRPFNSIDYALSSIEMRSDSGVSVQSSEVIVIPPGETKEYFVYNPLIQLAEFRMINVGATAKLFYYIKGLISK